MGTYDAAEFPIYAAPYRLYAPILDNEGNLVIGGGGLDAKRSVNAGSMASCTNNPVETLSSGTYSLDLTATEMTSKCTVVQLSSTSVGSKPTIITLFPKRMPILRTGTAASGGTSQMTLDAGASAKDGDYVGMFLQCTNNVPAGVQGQVRKITFYSESINLRRATVDRNWEVTPSSSTTFAILVPDTANINGWMGKETADPEISGIPAGLGRIPVSLDGKTLAETLLLVASTILGKKGGAIGSPWFRALDDSQDRVLATTDFRGNRSSVTLDPSSP